MTSSETSSEEAASARRLALERTRGVLSGVYPPDYLDTLREDWPA